MLNASHWFNGLLPASANIFGTEEDINPSLEFSTEPTQNNFAETARLGDFNITFPVDRESRIKSSELCFELRFPLCWLNFEKYG